LPPDYDRTSGGEHLEHDRYALRRSWLPAHDPAELRRIAEIWGVRLGF